MYGSHGHGAQPVLSAPAATTIRAGDAATKGNLKARFAIRFNLPFMSFADSHLNQFQSG